MQLINKALIWIRQKKMMTKSFIFLHTFDISIRYLKSLVKDIKKIRSKKNSKFLAIEANIRELLVNYLKVLALNLRKRNFETLEEY
ncbi:hypothetical protein BpHYR1_052292 [Brachionus plicatilis]|uniref:Uncharacterized protein n=1 Tax=Brachionus plicatilis TaxID=10195 RepID=A0A3M7RMP0_BRAPC|nr:hypothetical protein BpHYR1_052292 [Brachionus plicatilis]